MNILRISLISMAVASFASAAEPTPTPAPDAAKLKEFAARFCEAASDSDRAALLRQTNPDWVARRELRDEVATIQFKRSLEGDYVQAEAIARGLLQLTTETNDEEGTALARTLLGGVLREFGEYTEALSLQKQALEFYGKQPHESQGLVRAHQSIAIIFLFRADFSQALAHVNQALTIAQRIKFKEGVIPALNTTGEVFRTQGQPERALEFYERARKEVGDDNAWNMAYIFNNIGQAYEALGDTAKAVDFINRARAIAEKVQFRPRVATSLAVLGNLHLTRHEIDAARQSYEQSRALSVELHDRTSEARGLLGLARCALAEQKPETALEQAQQAAALYLRAGYRAEFAIAETTTGRAFRALGRIPEARASFEKAIGVIEEVRSLVAGGASELESFFATQVAPYEQLVSIFIDAKQYGDALAMAERASARTLLDIVASGKPDVERAMNAEERERAGGLDRTVAELKRALQLANGNVQRDEQKIAEAETALSRARGERDSFQAQLLAAHPEWKRAFSAAKPASAEEANQLAAKSSRAYLKFVVADDRSFLFVLRGGNEGPKLQVFALNRTTEELERIVEDFRAKLASRSLGWQEPARKLFDILLQESEPSWKAAEELVIIPDGPLWGLPFQALRSDEGCLLEGRAISYAPSLAFLTRHEVRSEDERSRQKLLAIGNPALGMKRDGAAAGAGEEEWQPLPAAERQVAELGKIYEASHPRLLVGEQARETEFKAAARDFDVLHFATHGVINDRAPLYSYLLFAQTHLDPEEDGLLEARELMQMNLPARLAVLSACETARGHIRAGEGVIGLSWAFLIAGCPTTVVSQWKVDSDTTTELMVDFHRRLHAGVAPAEALRAASLSLAKDARYRHPFYWAPFVVVGANR